MKQEEIKLLFQQFEQVACVSGDVECWSARELCELMGYKLWQNFTKAIDKAKAACSNVGQTQFGLYEFLELMDVYSITHNTTFKYSEFEVIKI